LYVQDLALHFEHRFYEVPAHTQSNMSTVGKNDKGSLALVAPVGMVLPIHKDLKILTLDVFHGDRQKLKAFLV